MRKPECTPEAGEAALRVRCGHEDSGGSDAEEERGGQGDGPVSEHLGPGRPRADGWEEGVGWGMKKEGAECYGSGSVASHANAWSTDSKALSAWQTQDPGWRMGSPHLPPFVINFPIDPRIWRRSADG